MVKGMEREEDEDGNGIIESGVVKAVGEANKESRIGKGRGERKSGRVRGGE